MFKEKAALIGKEELTVLEYNGRKIKDLDHQKICKKKKPICFTDVNMDFYMKLKFT